MREPADFFVSYTGADWAWAEWIVWQLETEGYRVVVQAWDFRAGNDFVHEMHTAAETAHRTIAVLSPAYLESQFGEVEWQAALAQDPSGEQGRLVPVRVAKVEPPGLLRTRIYIDLVGKNEEDARTTLLERLAGQRPQPSRSTSPAPDAQTGGPAKRAPPFPGLGGPASASAVETVRRAQSPWSSTEDYRLPPKPRCFGRAPMVADLVEALLSDRPPPVPVLGPPGIGKSNLCLTALHDKRIVARFSKRRFFVRCDGSSTADALLVKIGATIGIVADARLDSRIEEELTNGPCVLVLDNLETAWEEDVLPVERLLSWLADMHGVALLVSLRGGGSPGGPTWHEPVNVQALMPPAAQKLFLAVAGEHFANDSELASLVDELEGMPLAIELLAKAADAERTLAAVRKRWDEEHAAMLSRGTDQKQERELSLPVSLELSINAPRMNDDARRLLSLLCLFPDGLVENDVVELQPPTGRRLAAKLREVGLAFADRDRLRVLKPIRDHVCDAHPPGVDDYPAVARWFRSLVGGPLTATRRTSQVTAIKRLVAESVNLNAIAGLDHAVNPFDEFRLLYELATLRSRWTNVPGEVLHALARIGNADEAIAEIEMVNDLRKRCQAYVPIAQGLSANPNRDDGTSRHLRQLLENLRTSALEIGSPWQSAQALAAIAQALATLGDRQQSRTLAAHAYEIATSLASLHERGYSLVAIASAMAAAGDRDSAQAVLREAHGVVDDLAGSREQAHMLDVIGKSLLAAGEHARALELASKAPAIIDQLADPRHQDHARLVSVRIFAGVGKVSTAQEMLGSITEPGLKSDALAAVAQAHAMAGSVEEARHLRKEITIASHQARVLATVAERLLESGYRDDAADTLAEARVIANEPPKLQDVAHAFVAVAQALLEAGHQQAAGTILRHAQEVAVALADVKEQMHALAAVARQLGAMGRQQEGHVAIAQAAGLTERIDDPREQIHALAALSRVLTALGQHERAILLAGRARKLVAQVSDIERAYGLIAVARALAAAGSVSDALDLAEEAQGVLANSPDRGPAHEAMVTIVATLAQLDRLQAASDLAETIHDHVERSKALAEVAIGFARAARRKDAFELADRALRLIERDVSEYKRDAVRLCCVRVFEIAGGIAEAVDLAEALHHSFNRAQASAIIANAHAHANRLDEARRWMDQSMRLASERTHLRIILGQTGPALVAVHGPETTIAIVEALRQIDERQL